MNLDQRPTLPATLKPGDKVFVRRTAQDMRGRSADQWYIPAEVVKAARVWITIKTTDQWLREYRMRRDKQSETSGYGASDRSFVTPEQREYDDRIAEINAVIDAAGVDVERHVHPADRKWTPSRRAALADFIISLGILDAEQ